MAIKDLITENNARASAREMASKQGLEQQLMTMNSLLQAVLQQMGRSDVGELEGALKGALGTHLGDVTRAVASLSKEIVDVRTELSSQRSSVKAGTVRQVMGGEVVLDNQGVEEKLETVAGKLDSLTQTITSLATSLKPLPFPEISIPEQVTVSNLSSLETLLKKMTTNLELLIKKPQLLPQDRTDEVIMALRALTPSEKKSSDPLETYFDSDSSGFVETVTEEYLDRRVITDIQREGGKIYSIKTREERFSK